MPWGYILQETILNQKTKPISLKNAREQGKLDEFIKEHEKDQHGDADRLAASIRSAIQVERQTTKPRTSSGPDRQIRSKD